MQIFFLNADHTSSKMLSFDFVYLNHNIIQIKNTKQMFKIYKFFLLNTLHKYTTQEFSHIISEKDELYPLINFDNIIISIIAKYIHITVNHANATFCIHSILKFEYKGTSKQNVSRKKNVEIFFKIKIYNQLFFFFYIIMYNECTHLYYLIT